MISPSRHNRTWLVLLLAGAIATFVLPSAARAAAEPGVIEINGTTSAASTSFNLTEIGTPTLNVPGRSEKGWSLRKVLLHAQDVTGGAFDIDSFVKPVEVSRTGGEDNYLVAAHWVNDPSMDNKLPIYFLDADGFVNMRDPSRRFWVFTESSPQIFIPKSGQQVSVNITSPKGSVKLDAGDSQEFVAKVNNPGGQAVTLTWTVDSAEKQSGGSAGSGRFKSAFPVEGSFTVAVFVKTNGEVQDADSVSVIVGKAPEPKKKKKKDEDGGNKTPTDDGGYVPGYTDGYGDYGGGTGTGNPSPGSSSPSPQPQKQDQRDEQPPADDGLETVSGELVDPNQIATVVPPTDSPASGSEEASPAENDKGGGGISDGALTALGIGALLGLGGLAEAGAFAGFRRFRLRP